jgi:hypothetical protein
MRIHKCKKCKTKMVWKKSDKSVVVKPDGSSREMPQTSTYFCRSCGECCTDIADQDKQLLHTQFGLGFRSEVAAWWSARAIYHDREYMVEILWDRQCSSEQNTTAPGAIPVLANEAAQKKLTKWLNLKKTTKALKKALEEEGVPRDGWDIVEIDDGDFFLIASPRASHGYLYIGACLKKDGKIPEYWVPIVKETPPAKVAVEEPKKEPKWGKFNRNIKEGEIIRFKPTEVGPDKPPEDWDGYVYGIARGGFGMNVESAGRAIFVKNESWSEKDSLGNIGVDARWDTSWGIEIKEVPK